MPTIAVVDLVSSGWTAGGTYSEVCARSLAQGAPSDRVLFLSRRTPVRLQGVEIVPLPAAVNLPLEGQARFVLRRPPRDQTFRGEGRVRQALRLKDPAHPVWVASGAGAEVVFPVVAPPAIRPPGLGLVGWIPDFQHAAMPENFSAAEIEDRDLAFQRIGERCHRVVVSSHAVASDFVRLLPEYSDKVVVVPFPSRYVLEPLGRADRGVAAKYGLPQRYLLCANQFWSHKNHLLLVESIALLKSQGLDVTVVMTGLLADYRDPTLKLLSELLQAIATAGVHDQVRILGLVPLADFDDLLRGSAGVVQPSGYEGWSTTVEDAKALGKQVICSDIPVHREQVPDALAFFSLDPGSCAHALRRLWEGPEGTDLEHTALGRASAAVAAHAVALRDACLAAAGAAR